MAESGSGARTDEGRRPRVAVIHDYLGIAERFADWSPVEALADVDFISAPLTDEDAVVEALADYDVISAMRERLPLTATLMDRLPRLRCFVATSQSNRAIDFAAAKERGIEVAATANGSHARVATAELTWGLIIAATRGIVAEDRAIRAGRWQTGAFPALYGRTIGIVGLGGTGRYLARFAREFGMHVLAYSPHLSEMDAVESGAEAVGLDELLERSDVVTLHLVLSESTRHLIDARGIARMKPSAVLVNTSRGPIVDEAALIEALRDRRIAGAALDVFDVEPLPAGHPLTQLDNVVLSPHAAGFTEETYRVWYEGSAEAVLAFLEGRDIPLRHRTS
ncbi:D-2-hydroxyacid dehydrogenase family protein [Agromyces aerolatus]|uniref:D-2-hydroxyacid dehydrogenase family protein n=1 Tax=Agromyces sp. LY-1074 TaxID=3074080 RepID=UPI002865FD22|nr:MULTISPECIES: D-2-hydroxyacid dehydrogenase family protein [unclassified Agromyces]MDR5699103.1 D-2-hydroxyacid dehydrogenase family protein [Agromyces sp. LY-1074]MDR5705118.1 D-2-hydroxyacid dehydrogenase family protein [Agromyces sp. LY-1358]